MLKQLSPILSNETRWYRNLWDPVVFGTLCGILSAVAYTAANSCLRAVIRLEPSWVMTIKAIPTLLIAAPWVAWTCWRGKRVWSNRSSIMKLVAAALFGHFAGNLGLQWSFGVIGMALTVPLTLGSMIVSGAILGRLVLGEAITARTVASILILIGAIATLSLGAGQAHASVAPLNALATHGGWSPFVLVMAGVLTACFAGFAYTVLGVAIRYNSSAGMSQASALLVVSAVGFTSLGLFASTTQGWQSLENAQPREWLAMGGAGVFNAIAFVALVRALQLTSLVFVNGVNASQAALAAIAGVLFFEEAATRSLYLGVALTVGGLMLMRKKRPPVKPPQ